uniref:Uncharacterized protein MANES_S079200 n=1 Tax=Rhizophora mucronata TaxID=61149 RepID=A0A2P2L3I5_RHIMU
MHSIYMYRYLSALAYQLLDESHQFYLRLWNWGIKFTPDLLYPLSCAALHLVW